MTIHHAMNERAAAQHGLVASSDLSELGASRSVRRRLLEQGAIEQLGRRTFRVGGSPPTALQRVLAACLDTGGAASHGTAAALHSMRGFSIPEVPQVTIRRGTSRDQVSLAHVHTSTWLPDDHVVQADGVPCLSVARTLFSLAGQVPAIDADTVVGAVNDAVAARKATDAWLWWLLEKVRCRGRNGVAVFEEILAGRALGNVTESWLEREFLRVLEAAGAPAPMCQERIQAQGSFVGRVDFSDPELGIVIEVSGHAWHHTRAQRDADTKRRRRLTLEGKLVLEFTYDDVVARPEAMVTEVEEARRLRAVHAP